MRACLYFYDPLTAGKFPSFEKKYLKKDAETHAIVLLQYLGQRVQATARNLLGEAGGGAGNQRAAVLIVTITVRTSDITIHSQTCS